MLTEQIIEFKLSCPGPLGRYMYPTTGCFHNKAKSLMANLQMDCYLLLKYSRRGNLSYFRLPGQITYRVKPFARFQTCSGLKL